MKGKSFLILVVLVAAAAIIIYLLNRDEVGAPGITPPPPAAVTPPAITPPPAVAPPAPKPPAAKPTPPPPAVKAEPKTHSINIQNFAFASVSLNVKKGDTVVWTNADSAPHTVTGGSLNSPTLNKGDTYRFTFNSAGTFSYKCNFHPAMVGAVVVAN